MGDLHETLACDACGDEGASLFRGEPSGRAAFDPVRGKASACRCGAGAGYPVLAAMALPADVIRRNTSPVLRLGSAGPTDRGEEHEDAAYAMGIGPTSEAGVALAAVVAL